VVVWWWKKFSQEEKETSLEEKVRGGFRSDRKLLEKAVLAEVQLHVKVVLEEEVRLLNEGSSDRAPRRSESFGDSTRPRRPRRD
jgi:hypothetical protein